MQIVLTGGIYPQYQMTQGTTMRYVHLTEAVRLLADNWEIGSLVRESDGKERKITPDEQRQITSPQHEWFED